MQTQFGDVLIEKRSIDYIPLSERHGKVWHLWPVWFSGDAHLATVATGVVGVAMGGTLDLDGDRRRTGIGSRHVFHGVPFHAGPAARIAADDPVAAAVRICRCAPRMGRGVDRLHRLQRLQSDSRGADASFAVPPAGHPHVGDLCAVVGVARRARLRHHPRHAALGRLCDHCISVDFHRCRDAQGGHPGGATRTGHISSGTLSGAVLRRRRLPGILVDLCVRLLPLPAARGGCGGVVLVDLSRRFRRRLLDHAGGQPWRRPCIRSSSSSRRCVPRRTPRCRDSARHCFFARWWGS